MLVAYSRPMQRWPFAREEEQWNDFMDAKRKANLARGLRAGATAAGASPPSGTALLMGNNNNKQQQQQTPIFTVKFNPCEFVADQLRALVRN